MIKKQTRKFLIKDIKVIENLSKTLLQEEEKLFFDERDKKMSVILQGKTSYLTFSIEQYNAASDNECVVFNYEIPVNEAKNIFNLLDQSVSNSINKKAYSIEFEGIVWQVNEYGGNNQGLKIVSIEWTDNNQIKNLPDWIGEEITDNSDYDEAHLFDTPYPEIMKRNAEKMYYDNISDILKGIIKKAKMNNNRIEIDNFTYKLRVEDYEDEDHLIYAINLHNSDRYAGKSKIKKRITFEILPVTTVEYIPVFIHEFKDNTKLYLFAKVDDFNLVPIKNVSGNINDHIIEILSFDTFFALKKVSKDKHFTDNDFLHLEDFLKHLKLYDEFNLCFEREVFKYL